MLRKAGTSQRSHSLQYPLESSALLVLDMQGYFLDPSSHAFIPSGRTIIPRLGELVKACSKRGMPVIFTRHLNSAQDAGQMATWWRELITVELPSSRVIPELDLSTGIVLEKSQYDAFYNTPLEGILRSKGVRQVIIGGVMTHLCCETTARSAFMRGFEVFFLVDGSATYHEGYHMASLLNLSHGFACLKLVKEIMGDLERENAG